MSRKDNAAARQSGTKADRTRARILEAAERYFSERGYTDTRLEDIARDVGVKRAALFYHFRDKQSLYEAVKDELFGDLLTSIERILTKPGSAAARLEASIEAWVDALASHPSMARILLREAAGTRVASERPLLPNGELFLDAAKHIIEDGTAAGELNPIRPDPFHVVSAVVGFTLFYSAALRSLIPSLSFDPRDPVELAAHKADVVRVARRLLGIGIPRVVRPGQRSKS